MGPGSRSYARFYCLSSLRAMESFRFLSPPEKITAAWHICLHKAVKLFKNICIHIFSISGSLSIWANLVVAAWQTNLGKYTNNARLTRHPLSLAYRNRADPSLRPIVHRAVKTVYRCIRGEQQHYQHQRQVQQTFNCFRDLVDTSTPK